MTTQGTGGSERLHHICCFRMGSDRSGPGPVSEGTGTALFRTIRHTRSLNHDYKNEKKHDNSFMHLHQEKSHNNENENFKLSVTHFYGNNRLSCEIAEAVILRQRTGEILNLKSEFHNPPIVKVTRSVQRGF